MLRRVDLQSTMSSFIYYLNQHHQPGLKLAISKIKQEIRKLCDSSATVVRQWCDSGAGNVADLVDRIQALLTAEGDVTKHLTEMNSMDIKMEHSQICIIPCPNREHLKMKTAQICIIPCPNLVESGAQICFQF
jgi:hypothetical protein